MFAIVPGFARDKNKWLLMFRRPSKVSINEIIEANKIIEDKELRVRTVTSHYEGVWVESRETLWSI